MDQPTTSSEEAVTATIDELIGVFRRGDGVGRAMRDTARSLPDNPVAQRLAAIIIREHTDRAVFEAARTAAPTPGEASLVEILEAGFCEGARCLPDLERLRTQLTPTTAPGRTLRRRGSQLVEFALVLPMFLVMLLVIIDGGRMILAQVALNEAAYSAARAGAQVGGTQVSGSQNLPVDEVFNDTLANDAVLSPTTTRITSATPLVCTDDNADTRVVRVELEHDFTFLTPGLYSMLSVRNDGFALSATGVARCEVIRE